MTEGNKTLKVLEIETVTGAVQADQMGITDAHNHVWISKISGASAGVPYFDDEQSILAELKDYRKAGGNSILDCQPGKDCGRDGIRLLNFSKQSGVKIVASTGFHRRQYYAPDEWIFSADEQTASDFFISEIEHGLEETCFLPNPVKAGFIKIACEENLKDTSEHLLIAAAETCRKTGKAIEIHTEKGSAAVEIIDYFIKHKVNANRLILCHMDKRPDFSLHRELIQAGALLEYDTFFRQKYEPEKYLWRLIEQMISAGFSNNLTFATDMADPLMWKRIGNGPGLVSFPTIIKQRLLSMGVSHLEVDRLLGSNVINRLLN